MQPAQTVLSYAAPTGESYIDLAEGLSQVNRRAYRQGMEYAIGKISFAYIQNPQVVARVALYTYTAGDTWVVHNAWKKAYAYWIAQQRRARRLIGQSAKPTWEDFKVFLDDAHRAGTKLAPIASDGGAVGTGEWDYSVLHVEAEDHSIQEWYMHLIGGDISTTDRGLILGYQESRSTVQAEDPDLPAQYSSSMYASLADDIDDVAREVADDMEAENDEPPYDHDDYPGSDSNADVPWLGEFALAGSNYPMGVVPGFVAQCGLMKIKLEAFAAADGSVIDVPTSTLVQVHLVPGPYKGIAAFPMGQ